MGLLTIIRKVKRNEREIRILLVGLDNAGKTTIVKKLCGEDISTVSPTLGFQIKTVHRGGYALNIWDIGGQKSLRSYWRNYFEKTDALIWVVDSADVVRMRDCEEELHKLLKEERLSGATLLVLANKQDMKGSLSVRDIEKGELKLDTLDANRHWAIYGSSAVTGQGLDNAFDWLIRDAGSRLFLLD
ncbi:ADP-ribosylation factor-like protein 2 [Picochlorum sp. SENEW3]|nr:ADP-ribosylation factor-like protein 2 [Picochlorum sp. SENEW3]